MLWICTLPKTTPFIFEFKMWVFRGVTAGTWTCSPLEKGKQTSTIYNYQSILGFQVPAAFVFRGPKVDVHWGIEFTLREFYSIHKPPNSPIFPDSYFPTSEVWNLSTISVSSRLWWWDGISSWNKPTDLNVISPMAEISQQKRNNHVFTNLHRIIK